VLTLVGTKASLLVAWLFATGSVYRTGFFENSPRIRIVGTGVLSVLIAVALVLLWWLWLQPQHKPETVIIPASTPELHGVLIPANDPTPITECDIPPETTALFLGDSVAFTTAKTAAIRAKGDELISFKTVPSGVYISARVYSPANKVIAQITDNEMFVNPGNIFLAPQRPDWHNLIIRDNQGEEVLHVTFINKNVIKILGSFSTPSLKWPIVISEHHLHVPGAGFERNCFGNAGAMIDLTGSRINIGSAR